MHWRFLLAPLCSVSYSFVLDFVLCAWHPHFSSRGIIFILFKMLYLYYWNGCLNVHDFCVFDIYVTSMGIESGDVRSSTICILFRHSCMIRMVVCNACKFEMLVCIELLFLQSLIYKKHVWVLSPGMFDPQQFIFNLVIE